MAAHTVIDRLDLTPLLTQPRMSDRQLADLRAGLLALRAATLPDAFFDGHPARDDDTVMGLLSRIEIVAALDDVHALPELPR